MKKLLKNLEYFFDYTIIYLMYSPRKLSVYHRYMYKKWDERYCTKDEYEEYLRSLYK